MIAWTKISPDIHSKFNWLKIDSYDFAKSIHSIEVFLPELYRISGNYVIGFTRVSDRMTLVALLGLGGERNLYVDLQNKWSCDVVPLLLQYFPFSLFEEQDGSKSLCVDANHITGDSDRGNPIFSEGNILSTDVDSIAQQLISVEAHKRNINKIVELLDEKCVLVPWEIDIRTGMSDEPTVISDFYRIDEKKLNKIDDTSLSELRNNGGLMLSYAQIFSQYQLPLISRRVQIIERQISSNNRGIASISEAFSANNKSFETLDLDK